MSYLNELWSRPDRLVTQPNNSLTKDIDATHNYKNIKAAMYEPPYIQEPNTCNVASLPHNPEERHIYLRKSKRATQLFMRRLYSKLFWF